MEIRFTRFTAFFQSALSIAAPRSDVVAHARLPRGGTERVGGTGGEQAGSRRQKGLQKEPILGW
jgi:hypothetical protein